VYKFECPKCHVEFESDGFLGVARGVPLLIAADKHCFIEVRRPPALEEIGDALIVIYGQNAQLTRDVLTLRETQQAAVAILTKQA